MQIIQNWINIINWEKTWPMITGIGSGLMAIAVIISVIIAIKKYNQYFTDKKENYFHERQALCYGILFELNRNENLLKTIKNRGIIIINDIYCAEENIYQMILQEIQEDAYKNLMINKISFDDKYLLLDITEIYYYISTIRKVIGILIYYSKRETRANIKNTEARNRHNDIVRGTYDELTKKISNALNLLENIYNRFNNIIGLNFIESKYYKELK